MRFRRRKTDDVVAEATAEFDRLAPEMVQERTTVRPKVTSTNGSFSYDLGRYVVAERVGMDPALFRRSVSTAYETNGSFTYEP